MCKGELVMKYEKPSVEEILTDEEDVIRTSQGGQEIPPGWSPFV